MGVRPSIRVLQLLEDFGSTDFSRVDHSGQTVSEPAYRDKGFNYRVRHGCM